MNEDAAMRMCKPIPFLLDCVARAWAVKGAAGCNYFFVGLAKNLKSEEKMVILGVWQKRPEGPKIRHLYQALTMQS